MGANRIESDAGSAVTPAHAPATPPRARPAAIPARILGT